MAKSKIKQFLSKEIFNILQEIQDQYEIKVMKTPEKIIINTNKPKSENENIYSELITIIYSKLLKYVNDKTISNLPILNVNINDNVIMLEI